MDRESLYQYFIAENHTRKETAAYFNLNESTLRAVLKKYDIKKPNKLAAKNNKNKPFNTGRKAKMLNGHKTFKCDPDAKPLHDLPTRDAVYDDYIVKNLSRDQLIEKYNLSENIIKRLLKEYEIIKPKGLSVALRNKTVAVCNTLEKSFDRTPKEDLERYYIKENHSMKECCSHFNITIRNLKTIICAYDLHKPRELVKDVIFNTMMEKYGVGCGFDLGVVKGSNSKPNLNFKARLDECGIDYSREFYLNHFRYDFKVGDMLIEINPTITHNVTFNPFSEITIDKDYHYNKTKTATDNGFRCIHVWDWDNLDAIIKLLSSDRESIGARECEVREVSKEDTVDFTNKYHVQGYACDSIRYGLYYNDELVSIMTFAKPRYNRKYKYELIRYCSSKNIMGGADKLLKHFRDNNTGSIVTYCDNSKFNGNTYLKLGFNMQRKGKPTCHWMSLNTGQHVTDNLLRQRGYDQLFGTTYGKGTSNEQLMIESGFVKIYDCGQSTYALN